MELDPFQPFAPDGPPAYFVLATCEVMDAAPEGLYVAGVLDEAGHFVPTGMVEGDGPLADVAAQGWLELTNPQFCGLQTSRPPRAPYIEGAMTGRGFVPCSRTVVY